MDDEDNESFHSADEGEETKNDIPQKPTAKTPHLFTEDAQVLSRLRQTPANNKAGRPAEDGETTTATTTTTTTTKTKAVDDDGDRHKDKESEKLNTSFGDGWAVDTWDIEDDDVMVTPGTDRPLTDFACSIESSSKVSPRHADVDVSKEHQQQQAEHSEDLTAKRREVLEKLTNTCGLDSCEKMEKPSSLWGGWNSWLTVASDSITNLTNTVGEGLTSVLETMESTIGAPTPEELARLSLEERSELRKKADDVKEPLPSDEKDDCDSAEELMSEGGSDTNTARSDKDDLSSGYQSDSALNAQRRNDQRFTGLFTNVSHLLESTSRSLVTGSLDVMETLGKKTFHALTEPADETSQRRRLKFQKEHPSLSSVLKELKEKSDKQSVLKEQEAESRRCNYTVLFEDYQGMVNLEALEMLSEGRYMQLQTLLKSVSPERIPELDEALNEIKTSFDVNDEKFLDIAADSNEGFENFDGVLMNELILSKLSSYKPEKLMEVRKKHFCWIDNCLKDQEKGERYDAKLIYEHAIQSLAELTAASVETFHKIGQLLLAENTNPKTQHLANMTKFLVQEIGVFSTKYSSALNTAADDSEDPDSVNPLLTNLFLEANNSSSYIRDASQLLLPVLQVLCIQNSHLSS